MNNTKLADVLNWIGRDDEGIQRMVAIIWVQNPDNPIKVFCGELFCLCCSEIYNGLWQNIAIGHKKTLSNIDPDIEIVRAYIAPSSMSGLGSNDDRIGEGECLAFEIRRTESALQ